MTDPKESVQRTLALLRALRVAQKSVEEEAIIDAIIAELEKRPTEDEGRRNARKYALNALDRILWWLILNAL